MRPDRWRLRGFFEHEHGPMRSWVSAIGTLSWVLLPWVFWSKVRLHHEVKVRRMIIWPVVALGTLWLLTIALRVGAYVVSGNLSGWLPGQPAGYWLPDLFDACMFPLATWYSGSMWVLLEEWNAMLFGVLGVSLAWPVMLFIIPETRRRSKVRSVHVARAAVYGLAWVSFHIMLLMLTAVGGLLNADWNMALGMTGPLMDFLESWNGLLYGLVLVGWCGVWWWFAMARGFRVRHATVHWAVLMVPVLLFGFIVLLSCV